MKGTELYLQDGRPTGVFYCAECRGCHRDKETADKCCAPDRCDHCGKESGRKHWKICGPCESIQSDKREFERFEKAVKVTDHDGWVYLEGTGCRDGYHEDIGEFIEWMKDESEVEFTYVWACDSHPAIHLDLDTILENAGSDVYDDFDFDGLKGFDELKAAIAAFNEANKDNLCWETNHKTAVLIKKETP